MNTQDRPLVLKPGRVDPRTPEQLRQAYHLERDLARRLQTAPREQRATLYGQLYEDLLRKLPNHPQLQKKAAPEQSRAAVRAQLALLRHFLQPDSTFLELGAGDCALSLAVACFVRTVYAVEINPVILKNLPPVSNMAVLHSDGVSVPLPPRTADVAYSNQLMEHLHPDDASEQLANIHKALKSGGVYICLTPHRLSGPHDISRFFDTEATGFHLREYTATELVALFKRAGFSSVKILLGGKGWYVACPSMVMRAGEAWLGRLPHRARIALTNNWLGGLLGIRIIGRK